MSDRNALREAARKAAHDDKLLAFLRDEEERLTNSMRALREEHIREKRDVDELEEFGVGALFQKLLGTHEERLRKERREMVEARLRLDACVQELAEVRNRVQELDWRSDERARAIASFESALVAEERELEGAGGATAQRLSELRERIDANEARRHELVEALAAAEKARNELLGVHAALSSAASWGNFDMLAGGFFANYGKHRQLDQARTCIARVQAALRRLGREIQDTPLREALALDIGDGLTTADWLLDGLIVDWMVQRRIHESLERTNRVTLRVAALQSKLEASFGETNAQLERDRRLRETLLS